MKPYMITLPCEPGQKMWALQSLNTLSAAREACEAWVAGERLRQAGDSR